MVAVRQQRKWHGSARRAQAEAGSWALGQAKEQVRDFFPIKCLAFYDWLFEQNEHTCANLHMYRYLRVLRWHNVFYFGVG